MLSRLNKYSLVLSITFGGWGTGLQVLLDRGGFYSGSKEPGTEGQIILNAPWQLLAGDFSIQ